MVNGTAGWGNDPLARHDERRYKHPWSRSKSLWLLLGMMVFVGLLTVAGIHLVNLSFIWF